jgi:hypothetical protein
MYPDMYEESVEFIKSEYRRVGEEYSNDGISFIVMEDTTTDKLEFLNNIKPYLGAGYSHIVHWEENTFILADSNVRLTDRQVAYIMEVEHGTYGKFSIGDDSICPIVVYGGGELV